MLVTMPIDNSTGSASPTPSLPPPPLPPLADLESAWQQIVGHASSVSASAPELAADVELTPEESLKAFLREITRPAPPREMPPHRGVLPLNSRDTKGQVMYCDRGKLIKVTARPQTVAFRPRRLFVSSYAAPAPRGLAMRILWALFGRILMWSRLRSLRASGAVSLTGPISGADFWEIHDITIGNRSQLCAPGKLPGGMFSSNAADSFISFETAQTAMDITLIVSYVGPLDRAQFVGAIIGDVAQ
jgi:hypothetical protein